MILLNGIEIKPTIFPDKTSQVWKIDFKSALQMGIACIEWRFENEAEFMHVAQLRDLIDSESSVPVFLRVPYLPYARQDKPIGNKNTFALSTFCHLINHLRFDIVTCDDPHNETQVSINGFTPRYPTAKVQEVFVECKSDLVCYPDRGAREKYQDIYKLSFISAFKTRDPLTGEILSTKLFGDVKDKSILIVDDICDGGSTFVNLAKQLTDGGAHKIDLFVSHGIFSKGTQVLRDAGISRIFTREGEVKL